MSEERKLVTILFADVTGSTALGETLDPEDVRTLMGRYYTHARHVISQHEGTLEKFIGDAVMAVFGLPRAHGNDAERALASALALREAIADDALLGGLLLRMGINSGEVVATSDPSGEDFLVTGDAVNVAARLQQMANPAMLASRSGAFAEARASLQSAIDIAPEEEHLRLFERLGNSIVVSTIKTLHSSGRWSEISDLMPMLEHIWEEAQHDAGLAISVAEGYFSVLDIALAREDRAAADEAALVLERCLRVEEVNARALLAAYREDDPGLLNIAFSSQEWIVPSLVFLSEYGVDAPRTLISQVRSWPWLSDVVMQYVEIAEALEASDLARLATAIDEAETHDLIPHAARMRIVLAQRTGDRTQLERARPALERLGDHRSLHRLEEVAVVLNEREKLQ
jgi:hypothetical protein